jgi:hypothetical protein
MMMRRMRWRQLDSSRITGKPEVIWVRRPTVRNRDILSPLACVVVLPDNWFSGDSTSPVMAFLRHLNLVLRLENQK